MHTRQAVATLVAALAALLATATPAVAHGADAPDATNFRVSITGQPAIAGVQVRTIEVNRPGFFGGSETWKGRSHASAEEVLG